MELRGKKLGILLSTPPDHPGFQHGVRLAEAALQDGLTVYLYCIHDAVCGLEDRSLQALKNRGLNLYACAYAADRRRIPVREQAVFAGLTVVSDLIAATDRFVSFS
jgi:sulfur relay (sulfurtransferase) complex TusBCD TusD component (DsrE family)